MRLQAWFTTSVLLLVATLAAADAGPAFPVRYSPDGRYLLDRDGAPFPIMGRVAWFLTSLPVADYRMFVDDTVAKGHTAIEIWLVNHDHLSDPPRYDGDGNVPFLRTLGGEGWSGELGYANIEMDAPDLTTPNEAYWRFVDDVLDYCEARGLLVFGFPAYAGHARSRDGWLPEMVANGQDRARAYGAWLAARYRSRPNLVWMMGGDTGTPPYSFDAAQTEVQLALLEGVTSVPGQQSTMFSAEWSLESIATDEPSLGAAMTLNGAYSHVDVSGASRRAYAHSPAMPAFLLEEPYDEEGADGNGVNLAATQPVRRFQWWGWLSTIGGYIAGNGYIWRFGEDRWWTPWNESWQAHLDTQGSRDMARLNAFMRSLAWYELVPSGLNGMRALMVSGGSSSGQDDYVAAAANPDGTLLVAYVAPAHAGPIGVDMGAMRAASSARWFDPTTGTSSPIGSELPNAGVREFAPPGRNSRGENDWVLVLETE